MNRTQKIFNTVFLLACFAIKGKSDHITKSDKTHVKSLHCPEDKTINSSKNSSLKAPHLIRHKDGSFDGDVSDDWQYIS